MPCWQIGWAVTAAVHAGRVDRDGRRPRPVVDDDRHHENGELDPDPGHAPTGLRTGPSLAPDWPQTGPRLAFTGFHWLQLQGRSVVGLERDVIPDESRSAAT